MLWDTEVIITKGCTVNVSHLKVLDEQSFQSALHQNSLLFMWILHPQPLTPPIPHTPTFNPYSHQQPITPPSTPPPTFNPQPHPQPIVTSPSSCVTPDPEKGQAKPISQWTNYWPVFNLSPSRMASSRFFHGSLQRLWGFVLISYWWGVYLLFFAIIPLMAWFACLFSKLKTCYKLVQFILIGILAFFCAAYV